MEHVEIIHNKPYKAIAIMQEVAGWGRGIGLRVWPEEWLTEQIVEEISYKWEELLQLEAVN